MFNVYVNNKPCILTIKLPMWSTNSFKTKREAEIYAYLWCNSVTREIAAKHAPVMEAGKVYEISTPLSMGSVIKMCIKEEEKE